MTAVTHHDYTERFTNTYECCSEYQMYVYSVVSSVLECQTAVREVEGSSPRPDQHSGSYNI